MHELSSPYRAFLRKCIINIDQLLTDFKINFNVFALNIIHVHALYALCVLNIITQGLWTIYSNSRISRPIDTLITSVTLSVWEQVSRRSPALFTSQLLFILQDILALHCCFCFNRNPSRRKNFLQHILYHNNK